VGVRAHIWPIVGALAALGAARRYYRNWGSTKDECQLPLPGDDLLMTSSMQLTDAVSIDRCAAQVWPWLLQLGQDRAGLCSYETLENLSRRRRRSIDDVRPDWRLAPGDVIRLTPRGWLGLRNGVALTVTELIDGQAVVLRATPPELPCSVVWSFHLLPRGADRSRLLVRTRIAFRHPRDVVMTEGAGLLAMVMTRTVLLGIRRSAASQRAISPESGGPDAVAAESSGHVHVAQMSRRA
jgi:hypothetical protein